MASVPNPPQTHPEREGEERRGRERGEKGERESQGHIMAVGDAHVFPDFLTPVLKYTSLSHTQM